MLLQTLVVLNGINYEIMAKRVYIKIYILKLKLMNGGILN